MTLKERWSLLRDMWQIIQQQRKTLERYEAAVTHLQRENLDIARCNLQLCNALIVEINDPGTIDQDAMIAAAIDWADEIARREELIA